LAQRGQAGVAGETVVVSAGHGRSCRECCVLVDVDGEVAWFAVGVEQLAGDFR
jgi:hypothetical protein